MLLTKHKIASALLLVATLLLARTTSLLKQTPAGAAPQEKAKRDRDAAKGEAAISQVETDRLADGKARILFAHSIDGPTSVASIRLGEKKETLLSKPSGPNEEFQDGYRISPNGKTVAYRRQKQADNALRYAIHIRDLDFKGNPADMEVDGEYVCWSPDGSQIAVSKGQLGNVIVDVATKKQTEIKLPERHWIVDWSRDGTWFLVLCATEKDRWRLARMKKGESDLHRLPGADGDIWNGGRISPDGKQVLFGCYKTKFVSNLWIADLEEGKARQLTPETNGSIWGFSWSPSGMRIAYNWRRFDPDNPKSPFEQEIESFLMAIDSDGKNSTVLLTDNHRGISAVHFCFWDWR